MNDAVKNLIVRHCETLKIEARDIAQALDSAGLDDETGRVAAFKAAHKLKGSSGTLGFGDVSAAALRLESALRGLDGRAPTPGEVAEITEAHAALGTLIARIAPEQSTLYARMAG